MKILIIHDFYQRFGGEDAVALAERQLLEEHGNEVTSYTRHNDEIKSYNLQDKIKFFPDTIYSLRTRREIRALVRASRPDVAYVHNVFPLVSPSAYHALHALGIPIIQVLHDFRLLCANGLLFTHGEICERCKYGNFLHAVRYRCHRDSYVLSAIYGSSIALNRLMGWVEKTSAWICLTGFAESKLLEIGIPQEKIFIRPNFIDSSSITPAESVGTYVIFLGRLSREKGIWTLVRAFEQLKGIELKLVGTGPLEDAIRSYVSQRNLQNIKLVGFKSGKEKWELLRNSLFVVVPSEWYETFCIVVLEAYAAGKPVVASDIGGLPYVVRDGKSGMLFQPGSVADLTEKVRYLIERPAEIEAMGRYGRQLVETEYGPERAYDSLMAIFSAVCGAGQAPKDNSGDQRQPDSLPSSQQTKPSEN